MKTTERKLLARLPVERGALESVRWAKPRRELVRALVVEQQRSAGDVAGMLGIDFWVVVDDLQALACERPRPAVHERWGWDRTA